MARPRIPSAILADRGVPLTLIDGRKVVVCYNFRSLSTLEERHGSVQKAVEVVQQGADGAAFTSLAGILAAGLLHEVEPTDPENGQNGRSLGDPDVLIDYLDPAALTDYADAMGEAFNRSFPTVVGGEAADPTGQATDTSPGESGTTSPASASDSARTSSGA